MLKPAFGRGNRVPFDEARFAFDGCARKGHESHAARAKLGDLAVFKHERAPRMFQNRRNIRGNEILAVAQSNHQRSGRLGGDQLARLGFGKHHDRKRAAQLADHRAHRLDQRNFFAQPLFDQMGDQLGVGFGFELVTASDEHLTQLDVVFDNPVVDHGDRTGLMRMRVGFRRAAVRRPSRMAHPDMAVERVFIEQLAQIVELADRAADLEPRAAGQSRNPSRVITAILKPLQPAEQYRSRLARTDITHDSAHRRYSPPFGLARARG